MATADKSNYNIKYDKNVYVDSNCEFDHVLTSNGILSSLHLEELIFLEYVLRLNPGTIFALWRLKLVINNIERRSFHDRQSFNNKY